MEQSPKIGDRITDKSPPDESNVHGWIGREASVSMKRPPLSRR